MSRVPKNLKGLLKFCMEAGKDFTSDAEPMDPERAQWLREALKSMTVDLVVEMRKRIATIIQNISNPSFSSEKMEETTSSLDDLIDFTEDVNLADIFFKIGGLELLRSLFELPSDELYAQTGMLLSNIVQNNEDGQKCAIDNGLLEVSLDLLVQQDDPENLRGILSGISSVVRGNALGQSLFLRVSGFKRIFDVLEKTSASSNVDKYERFNQRMSFFIFCLCQELLDEQLVSLQKFHLPDKIVDVMLRLSQPSEFLARALVLLLNGRVSTLIDPEATPSPVHLMKFPLSKDSKQRLLQWVDSIKNSGDSALDIELHSEVIKALKD